MALRGGENLTIDYLRKKKSGQPGWLMDDEDRAPLEPADTGPWHGIVQQHEQAERIGAALVSIPAEYREAVVLVFRKD